MISVIITTYNRKEYLKNAIESVLNQSYKDIEIIIIDDCSTDGTEEEIKSLYSDNKNLYIYRNTKNQGPGINRKYALTNKAKGEYIVFLDDDDIFLEKDYFAKAIDKLNKDTNLSMVACNHIIYNSQTKEEKYIDFKYGEVVDNKEFFINFGSENFKKPIASFTVFRKKAFEETGGYEDMKIFNDTTIFLRALLYGPMGFINIYGGQYLIHGKNISFSCDCNFILDNLKEKYAIYKLINKFFNLNEEQAKKWLVEQCDITIVYYIRGSKPNKKELRKLYFWILKNLKSYKYVKKYKKLNEECKNAGKFI